MPGQQRVKRVVSNAQPWVAGQVMTVQLPRNYDIETVYLYLDGSVTYPATLVNAAVRSDAPYSLIKRIEIVAEGRQTLFSVPGFMLGMMGNRRHKRSTYFERAETYGNHQTPPLAYVSPTSAMTVSSTQPFKCTIPIDLQNIAGIRPKDTNLRSGGLQTLDLRVTLGTLTDMFFPLGGAPTVTPFAAPNAGALPTLTGYVLNVGVMTVAISEVQEIRNKDNSLSTPTFSQRFSHQTVNVPGVSNDFQMLLPTDNFIGQCLVTSKIGGQSVDGIINNFKLFRGVDVRYNVPFTVQGGLSNLDYDAVMSAGWYALDIVGAGAQNVKIADAWNLQGGADTRASFDVAAGSAFHTIDMTTCEYIPLRQG